MAKYVTGQHHAVALMLAALAEGDVSVKELQEASGFAAITIRSYISAFKKQNVIHHSGWAEDGKGRLLVHTYSLGMGKTVPKRNRTEAENQRRWRQGVTMKKTQDFILTALGATHES